MFQLGFKILLDYPAWFVLLCLMGGAGYAAVLYFRNRKDGFPASLVWLLATLRFFVVSIIALLLLGPLMQRITRTVEEPLLIFVQDNSQSIVGEANQSFNINEYLLAKNSFLLEAESRFDVRQYSFGEAFKPSDSILFNERLTDMSAVFAGIETYYSNRNIGALVLASDGIYNRGMNPVPVTQALPYPVYTIALGDTMPKRDLLISNLRHNRITYSGNLFPVEVTVEARQAEGMSSTVNIMKGGNIIASENMVFTSGHDLQTILFELEATEPGIQNYSAEVGSVEGEVSLANNMQTFYIEVIDARQKVLLLAGSPHPDVGAIKHALETRYNYEVTSMLASEFEGGPEAYNLVILHQLPSVRWPVRSLLERIASSETASLFIIGQQTNLAAFNELQTGLGILPRSNDFIETLPSYNHDFALFSLAQEVTGLVEVLPPLYSPFAQYVPAGALSVMVYQRIGQVITEQPLIAYMQSGTRKTGIIAGEGIWRWRLHSFLRDGHHNSFDDVMARMVQYLSVQDDRSLFRVRSAQLLLENDRVLIEAELYNRSYELVNEPEVHVNIINDEGVSFPYIMSRTSNAYLLDAGSFPPGEYRYVAAVTLGAEQFQAEGIFNISPLNLESMRTIADHNLLFQISMNTGGEMVYPDQWNSLWTSIYNMDSIKPVLYSRKMLEEIINAKGLFFLILLLLAIEWFARKRNGGY